MLHMQVTQNPKIDYPSPKAITSKHTIVLEKCRISW